MHRRLEFILKSIPLHMLDGLIALAILPIIAGLAWGAVSAIWLLKADHAVGTVVELTKINDGDGAGFRHRVQFLDREGERIEVVLGVTTYPPMALVGGDLPVVYRRDDPQDAKAYTFFSLWGGPVIGIGLGAFFMTPLLIVRALKKATHDPGWIREQ